jgi:hypothetical protein
VLQCLQIIRLIDYQVCPSKSDLLSYRVMRFVYQLSFACIATIVRVKLNLLTIHNVCVEFSP